MADPVVIHSKLSFSGRDRWRACPISVQLSAGVPDKPGPAAEEGTRAHSVAEWYVARLGDPYGLPPCHVTVTQGGHLQQEPVMELDRFAKLAGGPTELAAEVVKWNDELQTHGKAYRAFILSLIPAGEQAFISLEKKVSIPSISEHLFGTADCLIWLPRLRKLIVVDYKYGFMDVEIGEFDSTGKLIRANAQLAAYTVAAVEQCVLDADLITLAVYQPRRTFGKPEQVLDLPQGWLATERAALAREVAAVEAGGAPNPGAHCRYCKGRSKCQPVHNALTTALQAYSGVLNLMDIPKDDLLSLWAAKTAFKAFWEDIDELVKREAKAGNPRLTIKETKGRAMWADQGAAALTLMALGRTDLLKPGNVSECAPHMPEAWKAQLICTGAPSRSIRLVADISPSQVAATFAKYANPLTMPRSSV